MLESLHLKNVGPAPEMKMELAPRLNLITGDNGLGKSFLLDVAWWALTRKWPHDLNPRLTSGYPARPTEIQKPATIAFQLTGKTKPVDYESSYDPRQQAWIGKPGRPWNPGLVLYAHADGGFAVWDPPRNYWKKSGGIDIQVEDDWFHLELVGFQVIPAPGLAQEIMDRVQASIDRLRLNDFRREREEDAEGYWKRDYSLRALKKESPFVARELHRQGRLNEGNVW
jgi:hypothetical protein